MGPGYRSSDPHLDAQVGTAMSEVPSHAAAAPDAPTLTLEARMRPSLMRLLPERRRPKVHRPRSTRLRLREWLAPPRLTAHHRRAPSSGRQWTRRRRRLPPLPCRRPRGLLRLRAEPSSRALPVPCRTPGAELCGRHRLLHRRHRQHDPDPRRREGERPALLRDVQTNLDHKGKNVDELRVRVVAFRDIAADGDAAMQESPFSPARDRLSSAPSSTGSCPRAAATHRSRASRPSRSR